MNTFDLILGMFRMIFGFKNPWEYSIRKIERKEKGKTDYLLIGSSTFTLWKSVKKDLQLPNLVNNGFGGAVIHDILNNFDRIATPWSPENILIFVGTNDISIPKPATSEYVFEKTKELFGIIQNMIPGARIFYLPITPTQARWKLWNIANKANEMIKRYIESNHQITFIDIRSQFLDKNGIPDKKLFRMDKLHPNEKGYRILSEAINQALRKSTVP
jgi:lysophospholipase L1-like esterase